jgi:hypothetical protein
VLDSKCDTAEKIFQDIPQRFNQSLYLGISSFMIGPGSEKISGLLGCSLPVIR